MDRIHLVQVLKLAGITPSRAARILEKNRRTMTSWLTKDKASGRKVPPGEIERLCMIIDPQGEREDLIGWIVVAAHARWESSHRADH